jgi:hypothetical protein
MKRIVIIFCLLVFFAVLLCGCAYNGHSLKIPKEKIDIAFDSALQFALEGSYSLAYGVAWAGKKEFLATHQELPPRYTALMKLIAEKGIEESLQMMRLHYYNGRFKNAERTAAAVLWVAKMESIKIPEEAQYLINKIERGRQDMYLLNYNPEKPKLDI